MILEYESSVEFFILKQGTLAYPVFESAIKIAFKRAIFYMSHLQSCISQNSKETS